MAYENTDSGLTRHSVTGCSTGITAALFLLYNNWILEPVKNQHERELQPGDCYETSTEKVKRKARESTLEPGSVI